MKINEKRLWGHLSYLCEEIGARLSGTPADERSVEYIANHFKRCGVDVEVQDYPCPSWEHEKTELTLLGAGESRRLFAIAQTFSESCDLEAEFVGVGTRKELEFAPDLAGKILVLYGEAEGALTADRNWMLLTAEERRAAGLIVINTDETVPTKLIRDPYLRIPAVAVPHSVGLELLHCGGKVRLHVRARRFDSTGHNVIGHLPGLKTGRIAVAAHYDSAAECPGATDNASGTAVVLELCEIFGAAGKRNLGIDFIAYGAEEYGRHRAPGGNLGSVEYVRQNPEAVRETLGVVETDLVGTVASPPRVRYAVDWPARWRDGIQRIFRSHPRCIVTEYPANEAGCFHLPGVPEMDFVNSWEAIPIHTARDTIGYMSPGELAAGAKTVAEVVDYLSNGDAG